MSIKIGFIGLGIMGAPMAVRLAQGGHQLFVQTRSKVRDEVAAAGATVCASATEVAEQADVIFTMVPDTPDVERVLFGENGVDDDGQAESGSSEGRFPRRRGPRCLARA